MRLVHRVPTLATPDRVWEGLGDPRRWSEVEPRPHARRTHRLARVARRAA